jgi:hypothetical protein
MKPVQLTKYFLRFIASNRRKKYGSIVDGKEIFSSNYQDLAVINLFKQKRNGYYIEIGAQDPVKRSNTYSLETNFGWQGLSFEIDSELVSFFNQYRKNKCIAGDATQHDYVKIFQAQSVPSVIDYLQVDIDPPSASLAVLKKIPFDNITCSFITFEHDSYQFGPSVAKDQRDILQNLGYRLLAQDAAQDNKPFEDWWISEHFAENLQLNENLPLMGRDCKELALFLDTI